MKLLWKYIKKYKKEAVIAPLFKMLEAFFDLYVPIVTAQIIDVGIKNGDTTYILTRCGILILLGLVGLICSITAQFFAAKAAVFGASDLRRALFDKVQTLSFSDFDTVGTDTIITRLTSDVDHVQNGINLVLRLFLRSPFVVAGSVIMSFMIDYKIGLIFLFAVAVLALIVFIIMRITMPKYKETQTALDEVLGSTRENLTGVRVVRAFGREQSEIEDFDKKNNALNHIKIAVGRISALMNPMTVSIINIAIIAVLYTGAVRINIGTLGQGEVIALINYLNQILVELVKFATLVVQVSRALASLKRVEHVFNLQPRMQFKNDGIIPAKGVEICFEDVSMCYENAGENSLNDISFKVPVGASVGVIGGTGSGKTTLVNLIPRFYDVSQGKVTVGGKDVRDFGKEELRGMIGTVMQKTWLFSGTVRSNLLWGKNATDEELWSALETAQAADFIRKKGGLDAPVSQGGRNFSGGQRQRLTIARALVMQPKILILDDSTSALDLATDASLRRGIDEMRKHADMTVITVSQRVSGIMNCDLILVLDDGRLVGRGTHEELLRSCEVYKEIYDSQNGAQ